MKQLLLALVLLTCASGCYRMPSDDEYSLVPVINNPDITREPNTSMQSVSY